MITEFELNESSKDDEVDQFHQLLESMNDTKLVVAYFYAPWCGPCKVLSPMVQSLVETEFQDQSMKVIKINLDDFQDLGQDLRIAKLPAMVLFSNGEEKQRLFGLKTKDELKKKFVKVIDPSQSES